MSNEVTKLPPNEQYFVIKGWHTLLLCLILLGGIVLSYGTVRDHTDQNTEDIRDLKNRPQITKQDVDNLNYRLTRIENKIDAQDIQQFRRDAEATAAPKRR